MKKNGEIMYALRFLMTNLILSMILLVFLGIRRLLSRYWTAGCCYALWLLPAAALLVALLPFRLFPSSGVPAIAKESPLSAAVTSSVQDQKPADNENWLPDFTVALDRPDFEVLNQVIMILWCSGMIAALGLYLLANLQLKKICRNSHPPAFRLSEEFRMSELFRNCKMELGIRRNITLLLSDQVSTPFIYGVIHPRLILPSDLADRDSQKETKEEIRFILLHELTHYKNHDLFYNQMLMLLRLPYWFNPIIPVAIREFRSDRELYCDACLLHDMPPGDRLKYGHTILNFSNGVRHHLFRPFTTGFSGTKRQLFRRIEQISSYRTPSGYERFRGIAAFLLITLIMATQLPLLNTQAAARPAPVVVSAVSPSGRETLLPSAPAPSSSALDVYGYFRGLDGCMVLTDLNSGQYRVYNEEKSTRRISPDSTYKIYAAINALESGIIAPDQSTLPWNGQSYPFRDWEKDQSLQTAMRYSVNWYFQALDQKAGPENLKEFYQKIGYGNQDLSGGTDSYWLESSLAISPLEQAGLLKSFYVNEFGFQPENVAAVKEAIKLSSDSLSMLFGKTGSAKVNGNYVSTWFIGYVENPDNTWFFATNISNADNAGGNTSAEVTLQVLKDMGIYPSV